MMGFVDVLKPDATVELKVSELSNVLKTEAINWALNQVMINGLKAGIPHADILTMVGENEVLAEEIPVEDIIKKVNKEEE